MPSSRTYIIERDNVELTQRDRIPRVFVTGPHGPGNPEVWSSTTDPLQAARFASEEEALKAAASKHWRNVRVLAIEVTGDA